MEIDAEILIGKMKALISDLIHDKTILECLVEQKESELQYLRSSLVVYKV